MESLLVRKLGQLASTYDGVLVIDIDLFDGVFEHSFHLSLVSILAGRV